MLNRDALQLKTNEQNLIKTKHETLNELHRLKHHITHSVNLMRNTQTFYANWLREIIDILRGE